MACLAQCSLFLADRCLSTCKTSTRGANCQELNLGPLCTSCLTAMALFNLSLCGQRPGLLVFTTGPHGLRSWPRRQPVLLCIYPFQGNIHSVFQLVFQRSTITIFLSEECQPSPEHSLQAIPSKEGLTAVCSRILDKVTTVPQRILFR